MPPEVPSVDILGMRVSRINRSAALEALQQFIDSGQPHHVVTADASMVTIAAADPELLGIINRAALVTPDGTGILWAARRLGVPLEERVSGVDISEQLCAQSAQRGYGVYFYGAAPGVAERAAETIRARYPGASIVGTADGFQNSAEQQAALLADIRAKAPAVLLVAMGIPKQEKWIARHLDELGVPVCIGVGGTLDVFSGQVSRAPVWMQQNGLEWLYRLAQNPKKLSKVACLPGFVWRVLRRERLRSGG
jgi:N-acetylglucosaminyldiphosphoundecaprenol N-acetyl-beta-D-mannosaminyltransferase